MLDHATSENASGIKLGLDATKKIPGEGFKLPWSPCSSFPDEFRKKIYSRARGGTNNAAHE